MSYCDWDSADPALIRYHDEEWGVPLHDDRSQFEFLMLEAFQCGLSWGLMIRKRPVLRRCFDAFDYDKIASYGPHDIMRILATPGMIRSPAKVKAVINNAARFREIRRQFGTFSAYLWAWSGGKTILYARHAGGFIPTSNGLSDAISRDLRARGFKYIGSVTLYSHLQACGIINDHSATCPRYAEINASHPTVAKRRFLEKGARQY